MHTQMHLWFQLAAELEIFFFMCFYSVQPIMTKFVARIIHFHIRHGNVWISRLLKQGEFLVLTAFCTSVVVCSGDGYIAIWGKIQLQ